MKKMKRFLCLVLIAVFAFSLLPMTGFAAWTGVQVSAQKLVVDGEAIDCEKYNINGSNYFKLRDLAYLLNDTGSQFSVGYNSDLKLASIWTGEDYVSTQGLVKGGDQSATAKLSSQTIIINGTLYSDLTVYNIGGYNYFKLRDLAGPLNFDVSYDATTNTAVICSDYAYDDSMLCWVNTMDEFVTCLAYPNATIYLAPGDYDVTEWIMNARQGRSTAQLKRDYPYLDIDAMTDSFAPELRLVDCEGVRIIGSGADRTRILAEPRYANVVGFDDCLSITLRNMTFGHTDGDGYCTGAVLDFSGGDDFNLGNLELFGCGTYGICANGTTYLSMNNSVIRDCTYGAVDLYNGYAILFINSTFKNNKDLDTINVYQTGNVTFESCSFSGNDFSFASGCGFLSVYNNDTPFGGSEGVKFLDCTFGNIEYESLLGNDYGSFVTVEAAHIVA